jgi:hypothetical protein
VGLWADWEGENKGTRSGGRRRKAIVSSRTYQPATSSCQRHNPAAVAERRGNPSGRGSGELENLGFNVEVLG